MTESRKCRVFDPGRIWIGAVATLLLLGPVPAMAQELDRCVRAWVAHPIVLPDDSTHESGVLELCLRGKGPVSGRHEIRVNGMPTGQWPSRVGRSEEAGDAQPVVVLDWTRNGNLRLAGYTSPERGWTVIYLFDSYALKHGLVASEPSLRELFDGPERMLLLADSGR